MYLPQIFLWQIDTRSLYIINIFDTDIFHCILQCFKLNSQLGIFYRVKSNYSDFYRNILQQIRRILVFYIVLVVFY